MIFKIEMNYDHLDEILNIFRDKYDILFCQHLYISEKKKSKTNNCTKIKEKIKEYPNSFVTIIDEFNLSAQPLQAQVWCRDKFVEQDLREFEKNEQEKILNMMKIVQDFDKALEAILKEKSGGEEDGRRNKEEERKTSETKN